MRIIDADALREFFAIHGNEYTGDEMICIAPTITPDSLVKRGRWEEIKFNGKISFRCSECGITRDNKLIFCPNCHAMMDENFALMED